MVRPGTVDRSQPKGGRGPPFPLAAGDRERLQTTGCLGRHFLLASTPTVPRRRQISGALRFAALWVLMVTVFSGPAGLGGASVFATAVKTCGVSCPCDGAADEQLDEHAEHEAPGDDRPADGDPCQDECLDDCPHCGCCLGFAVAVVPVTVTPIAIACMSAGDLVPADEPPGGIRTGVFRPPRSPS